MEFIYTIKREVIKLGLVLESSLGTSIGLSPLEDAVNVYLPVSKTHLSEPYELKGNSIIIGEILEIRSWTRKLTEEEAKIEEVIGKEIRFILSKRIFGFYDNLYISKGSWPILRDYGILPDEKYIVKVKLTKAEFDKEIVEIYPKRDVIDGKV